MVIGGLAKIIMMILDLCSAAASVDETKRIGFAFHAMVAPWRIVEAQPRENRDFFVRSVVSKRKLTKKTKMQGVAWRVLLCLLGQVVMWKHTGNEMLCCRLNICEPGLPHNHWPHNPCSLTKVKIQ